VKVYGGGQGIPAVTDIVQDQQKFTIGQLQITALATPCHTTESISYLVHGEPDIIFTGDTLFTGELLFPCRLLSISSARHSLE